MLKRLLIVALCILSLPMLASISHSRNSNMTGPAMVAFAGHGLAGGAWCTCGCPDCVCDPGETPVACTGMSAIKQPDDTPRHGKKPTSGLDYGTGTMILALALFLWLRLRA